MRSKVFLIVVCLYFHKKVIFTSAIEQQKMIIVNLQIVRLQIPRVTVFTRGSRVLQPLIKFVFV